MNITLCTVQCTYVDIERSPPSPSTLAGTAIGIIQTWKRADSPPFIEIGERYSQTMPFVLLVATFRRCVLPYERNIELTQSSLSISFFLSVHAVLNE